MEEWLWRREVTVPLPILHGCGAGIWRGTRRKKGWATGFSNATFRGEGRGKLEPHKGRYLDRWVHGRCTRARKLGVGVGKLCGVHPCLSLVSFASGELRIARRTGGTTFCRGRGKEGAVSTDNTKGNIKQTPRFVLCCCFFFALYDVLWYGVILCCLCVFLPPPPPPPLPSSLYSSSSSSSFSFFSPTGWCSCCKRAKC